LVSVTVKLHGTLNRYLPSRESSLRLDLAGPSIAGGLLEELGVPFDVLDVLFVNGRVSAPETPLSEGDVVEAFPFLGGGQASSELIADG
jgi:molybdopterin converting factor small subunit